jgi:hypothetical protein
MASQEAWQAGHRASLPLIQPLCVAAATSGTLGAALGSWPPAGIVLVLVAAALLVLGAVGGAIVAHRAARAISRET